MRLASLFDSLNNNDTVEIPAGWTQGRANFGGLVAALLYARIDALIEDERVLRSATVSFVGPVSTAAVTLKAELLRHGKAVTQAEARMLQNGEVVAVMLASFGAARESAISVASNGAPVFKKPEECAVLPYLPGVTPEFTKHIDFRWAHGDFPFTGSALPELGGWMRLKEGRGPVDMLDLFMLVDAWPPALLPIMKGPAPGSTLCWTLEPVWLPPNKTAQHWWQYQAKTDYAADGYGNTQACIWDDEGLLVAISRQTVVVFA